MEFNKVIKEYRKANNLTQKELAERLQVPFRTYQNWELGYNVPSKLAQKSVINYIATHNIEVIKEGVIEWQKH